MREIFANFAYANFSRGKILQIIKMTSDRIQHFKGKIFTNSNRFINFMKISPLEKIHYTSWVSMTIPQCNHNCPNTLTIGWGCCPIAPPLSVAFDYRSVAINIVQHRNYKLLIEFLLRKYYTFVNWGTKKVEGQHPLKSVVF